MSRKDERKFENCQNIERKSIRWWEHNREHFNSKNVKRLRTFNRCFYSEVLDVLAEYFDYLNPGALKINYNLFCEQLFSFVKQRRTIKKSLEILDKSKLIFSWKEGSDIILYCPFFEKATEHFVKEKKRKRTCDEIPAGAGDLLERCKLYAKGLY